MQKTVNPFPEHRIYKFLDEATGLFWNGSLKETNVSALFNEQGIEYRSVKAADEAFRNYEVTRVGLTDVVLPVLLRLVYRVEMIEIERSSFKASPADMRLTRFSVIHKKESRLTGFVRQLHDHKSIMEYAYIVQRNPSTPVDVTPLDKAIVSSRKSGKKYIAVRTDADLLYLKMALGDGYSGAFDMNTGNLIQSG